MVPCGENVYVEVAVDVFGVHVSVIVNGVVSETGVNIAETGISQMLIISSPNRTSGLPNISSLYALVSTCHASYFVYGHACGTASLKAIGTRMAAFMSRGAGWG